MSTILRRLPFYADATMLRIQGGPALEIKHDQIVVWVSVAPVAEVGLPASSPRIPALLDLGFNGSFLLREDHVINWLNIQLTEDRFPFLGTFNALGHDIAAFLATVWLHPNVPGFRDQFSDAPPLRLEMTGGISVCPAGSHFRLPLLGLSALRKNRLRLLAQGEKRYISLRGPGASE